MLKSELRKIYKAKRLALSSKDKSTKEKHIISSLLTNFDFSNSSVHVFLPIEKLKEIDTFPILRSLFDLKCRVFTSIINSIDKMDSIELFNDTKFEFDKWGIPVPENCKELYKGSFETILVPLLYCDSNGNRIGYGKGYYDRFLKQHPKSNFIGLNYFDPDTDIEDVEQFDVKLTQLVSPNNVYRFK